MSQKRVGYNNNNIKNHRLEAIKKNTNLDFPGFHAFKAHAYATPDPTRRHHYNQHNPMSHLTASHAPKTINSS